MIVEGYILLFISEKLERKIYYKSQILDRTTFYYHFSFVCVHIILYLCSFQQVDANALCNFLLKLCGMYS